jgi:predicted Ser/Thr protein kinase
MGADLVKQRSAKAIAMPARTGLNDLVKVDPMIGAELAGYRIESLLGRGGMSVVYLAEQVRLGRKVALKVLSPELAEDADFRDRFQHESRLAASLDHPHVVPIHEAGEADGTLFIAMRYIPGATLEHLVQSEGPLEPQRAVAVLAQVADALDVAHEEGLVHRDVKPGNILLAKDRGGWEHAYLADFGLTKRRSSIAGRTKTGQFIGSIDYASPEQIEGKPPLDGRSDQYSLACVLYYCLTGHRPFERDSEVAVLYAHLKDRAPRPSSVRSEVPAELDRAVGRAMSKAPGDRYRLCSELLASAVPSVAPAPSRRSRTLLAAAALAMVALVAVAIAFVWARSGEEGVRRSEARTPAPTPVRRGIVRIDLASRELVATVPLEQPTWIDSTEDLIWALSPLDKLAKLRPGTNSVIGEIRLQPFFNPQTPFASGQSPDVVASDNAVWVVGRRLKPNFQVGRDDPLLSGIVTLSRVNPTTNTARNKILEGHADAAGLALGEGDLWTLDRDAGELLRLDSRTLEVVASIRVDATSRGPSSLAAGEGFVWATNATLGTVTKVDSRTNTVVATIPVEGAQEVATGEGAVWVTTNRGTVVAIGPGDSVLDEVRIGPPSRSETFHTGAMCCHAGAGILVTEDSVWVVSTGDGRLVEIDPVNYEVKSRIPIHGNPQDITAAAGSLWVSVR